MQNESTAYKNIQNSDDVDIDQNIKNLHGNKGEVIVPKQIVSDDGDVSDDDVAMQVSMEEVVAEEVIRINDDEWQHVMEANIDSDESQSQVRHLY